ncbi:hypothetical protein SCHPADRAFT_44548 [Schizopora paradoxa]|uniref:BTB domain-containing protein n=1 Tax=Schizopora paradoxa TaxID=27342 RepID=A0A0H2S6F3_9AGAM|nr:hypothetical protein SCHPADRAFT_44548 [Schizopora paradoxa]
MNDLLCVREDLTITSCDSVRFCVHESYLLAISSNLFGGFLPVVGSRQIQPRREGLQHNDNELRNKDEQEQRLLHLSESGSVLNILLCAAYGKPLVAGQAHSPYISLSDLSLAVAALKKYGIPMQTATSERSLMFSAFAFHCSNGTASALRVYAVAASYAPDMHNLAVYASQFLLSLKLSSVTDEIADEIGAVYLRKLFTLHLVRTQAFKRLLIHPPQLHRPNPYCNEDGGGALREAWDSVKAYLSWAAAPDVSNSTIEGATVAVLEKLTCDECRDLVRVRFLGLKQQWEAVKKTI